MSNLNKRAINIPGTTMSPNPSMAKLLASNGPEILREREKGKINVADGNDSVTKTSTLRTITYHGNTRNAVCILTVFEKVLRKDEFDRSFERLSNGDHDVSAKNPKDVVEEKATKQDTTCRNPGKLQQIRGKPGRKGDRKGKAQREK